MAMSHNTALPGHHKADKNFSASWDVTGEFTAGPTDLISGVGARLGNPKSNRSMSLKGEKSSMVVLWVEGSYEKRHFVNYRGGDDAIVIFAVRGLGVIRMGHTNITDPKLQEILMRSQN